MSVFIDFLVCVSVCVLASSAGPSCYHGDESRHRQSAVISYTLPTEFLLYSPLVYICVLSLHLYSHTFCLCKLYTPFSHVTPDQSLAFFLIPPQWAVESSLRCLFQHKATRSNGRCSRWSYNQYDPPMSRLATALLFVPVKDQSLLPSPLGHHRLTSPGLLFFMPSYHFHLGLPSPF